MDFHALLARMQEIERRQEPAIAEQIPATECGMTPGMSQMPPMPSKPEIPPPSMSVNLNAQGMDNIESMMKLFQKVNPDMMPKIPDPMPTIMPGPSMPSMKPSLPPLKMLPDLDGMDKPKEIEIKIDKPGGPDMDDEGPDMDDEGPDMDDEGPDMDDKKEKEAWENEPDTDEKSIDYMNNKLAGGMNKPKDTFPKVAGGDNPMQRVREDEEFRNKIKEELRQRLAEAKGVK